MIVWGGVDEMFNDTDTAVDTTRSLIVGQLRPRLMHPRPRFSHGGLDGEPNDRLGRGFLLSGRRFQHGRKIYSRHGRLDGHQHR